MATTLGLSKVFILDKYFSELQKFWETEKRLQGRVKMPSPLPLIDLTVSVNLILTLADVTCSPWFLKSMHCFSLRILFESTSRLVHRGTESSGKNAVGGEMLRRKSRLGGFRPYFRTGSELRSLSLPLLHSRSHSLSPSGPARSAAPSHFHLPTSYPATRPTPKRIQPGVVGRGRTYA